MMRSTALRPLQRAAACQRAATTITRRPISSSSAHRAPRLTEEFNLNKLNSQRRDYERNRTAFLTAGAVAGILSFIYTAWKLKKAIAEKNAKENTSSVKCDSGAIPTEQFKTEAGEMRKIVVRDAEGNELVPTGNSTVPTFPRIIEVDATTTTTSTTQQKPHQTALAASISDATGTEYTLVGLGMRTVTFIGIQVYLVGLYVATQDIARLQSHLVKSVNSVATTLIPSEKDTLRQRLLDPVEGEALWNGILTETGLRSVIRIAPVRDTDFHHLRDGFVRAIQARSQVDKQAYGDEAFGTAMKEFKALFNRGSVPKKKEMLLCRDESGALAVTYDASSSSGKQSQREVLGTVTDARLSQLLWLNYLAGSKVASEPARKNIVEGVMEFVERPVGTVAAQVV